MSRHHPHLPHSPAYRRAFQKLDDALARSRELYRMKNNPKDRDLLEFLLNGLAGFAPERPSAFSGPDRPPTPDPQP